MFLTSPTLLLKLHNVDLQPNTHNMQKYTVEATGHDV